ncbi:MAG: O-antigen ligase family protein [Planctomycetales bacterium]|nr:O-antigen ligase family protein [Planctomycetales bacterium]
MDSQTKNLAKIAVPPLSQCGWVLAAVGVVLSACFAASSFNYNASLAAQLEKSSEVEDSIENTAEQSTKANPYSAVSYLTIGAVGFLGLVYGKTAQATNRFRAFLPALLLVLLATASIFWSEDIPTSVRRVAALGLMFLGCYGVTRLVSLQQLALIFAVLGIGMAVVGVVVELQLGMLHPLSSSYRFCGVDHPNNTAMNASVAMLGAFALLETAGRWRWSLLVSLLVVGAAVVIESKSRSTAGATLLALVAMQGGRSGFQKSLRWAPAGVVALGVLALLVGLLGQGGVDSAASTAAMGRQEHVSSLTGRIPLWTLLLKMSSEHTLLGSGYGAFWNADRVEYVSFSQGWNVSHGHSIYINSLLELGVIGIPLMAWIVFNALYYSYTDYKATRDSGRLFAFGMAVLAVLHGLVESHFSSRGIPFFVYIAILAYLTVSPVAPGAAQRAVARERAPKFYAVAGGSV